MAALCILQKDVMGFYKMFVFLMNFTFIDSTASQLC